jgi:hypothetical protein
MTSKEPKHDTPHPEMLIRGQEALKLIVKLFPHIVTGIQNVTFCQKNRIKSGITFTKILVSCMFGGGPLTYATSLFPIGRSFVSNGQLYFGQFIHVTAK